MTNKSVAYDYMSTCLLQNKNIAESLPGETNLNEEDKSELAQMLNLVKGLGEDRSALQSMMQQENLAMRGETNKMLMENMHNTFNTSISIKTSLQDVIKDAKTAYRYVLWMYILAFLIGLGLIVVAVVSVSYTHLDVYKRQGHFRLQENIRTRHGRRRSYDR